MAGCNLKCSFCDTKHDKYTEMSIEQIRQKVEEYNCKNIVWTGGEPTLQLTKGIIMRFKDYYNCLETNGAYYPIRSMDYITVSPKLDKEPDSIIVYVADEVRIPIKAGDKLPEVIVPSNKKAQLYISPKENLKTKHVLVKMFSDTHDLAKKELDALTKDVEKFIDALAIFILAPIALYLIYDLFFGKIPEDFD